MSTTIGEVNINLRLSLAQFKKDVKDGTQDASNATKEMSNTMRADITGARGTISLLGEEIGVHLPRHLQTFIAKIPGVGTALNAAFSSVAILALIEVFAKIIEKIAEMKKHAEDVAEAFRKQGTVGVDSLRKLDEETLQLEAQLAELNGNYLQALLDKLKLIDAQSLDQLVAEFDKVEKEAMTALETIQRNWILTVLGFANHGQVKGIEEDLKGTLARLDEIKARGGSMEEVGNLLRASLERVNVQLAGSKKLTGDVVEALEYEKNLLENQLSQYTRIAQNAKLKKDITNDTFTKDENARLEAEARAREEITQKVRELAAATKVLLAGEQTEQDKVIAKIEEEIAKYKDLDAERQRQFPGIKTYYGEQIAALQEKLKLEKEVQATEQAQLARGVVPGFTPKLPDLFAKGEKPNVAFGGTTDQLELAKITTDAPAAQAALTKVLDSIEPINEKFKEQSAILEKLHKQYPDVFSAEQLKRAKDAIDPVKRAWLDFGASIGEVIRSGELFGRNWQQALTSVITQLIQLTLQMTLFKAAAAGAGAGGGGGFLSSFIGSIFGGHRAKGGGVDADKVYEIGENGPEWFAPGVSGTIIPNITAKAEPHVTYQHIQNITTPDADSFKKSQSQLAADAYEHMFTAHARNR